MTPVVLACASAALFGAMTIAIRLALQRGADAEAGALATIAVALVVVLVLTAVDMAVNGVPPLGGIWPFALAGVLGPAGSQVFFTLGVRDAGASRTSVVVGTAPLISVTLALLLLDEPFGVARAAGAALIVMGGATLLREGARPAHFRLVGLAFAATGTVLIATRDTLLRWLSVDTDVSPLAAVTASLATALVVVAAYLAVRQGRPALYRARHDLRAFALPGVLFGLSYASLFEAYYHGRVTLVSPLIATESLWAVALAALVMRRSDVVGPRLAFGAALVVAGGVLIGVTTG